MKKRLKHINILMWLCVMAMVSSCSDIVSVIDELEDAIRVGEQVHFSAVVPQPESTRAITQEEDYNSLINKFKNVQDLYTFKVTMLTKNNGTPKEEGNTMLIPMTTADEDGKLHYDANAYLTEADENTPPLYWQSNVTPYAFEAVSHEPAFGATVSTDQSTDEKFFAEDYIKGYGYVKAWDNTNSKPQYELESPNYLTSKQWYAANKALGFVPEGLTTDYYKTIPLYMQHQRARISVILRAGEGVDREQLQYDTVSVPNITTAREKVKMEIFSYKDATATAVKPLLSGRQIEYDERGQAEPTQFWTACYDAIVEPHAYADNATEHKIAAIEVSNMKFSFYAANDTKYGEYLTALAGNDAGAASKLEEVKSRYNLKPGDHLVIDVTLSTGDRKILITAYVVDWEDWPFVTKCDDYGHAGDPIAIHNRKELIDFLLDGERNKAGNIAFISPTELNLEEQTPNADSQNPVNDTYAANWGEISEIATANAELKATLSLAGAKLKLNHTLLPGGIASSGSIVNGTLEFGNAVSGTAPTNTIDCAVANHNAGSIERITVSNIKGSKIKATKGGLVDANYGNIYRCTSNMPVILADNQTSETYVGGIAATSMYPRGVNDEANTAVMPVIDMCTVNARVAGGDNVYGGGIVGKAEGKITNNTFEYGITILQEAARFKNIIGVKGEGDLYNLGNVHGNQWPTNVPNKWNDENDGFSNERTGTLYSYVLDSEEELRTLLTTQAYNIAANRIRISNDFTVKKETWKNTNSVAIGNQSEDVTTSGVGNVFCEIDGNGCTISLDGATEAPMLFSNILSHVHDMTIVCLKDVKSEARDNYTDAVAPLAYSVSSTNGKLSGIKVKMATDKTVSASNPSGLVVRAFNGAVIEDCESNAKLNINLPSSSGIQASYFVGGIVNAAGVARISRCTYHGGSDAIAPSQYGTVYYGGIVGGAELKDTNPEIEITDCNSWLSWSNTDQDNHQSWGGIIGYAVHGTGTNLISAMKNCQGNWWLAPKPIGQSQAGKKDDDVIGKMNSIVPQQNTNYGNY